MIDPPLKKYDVGIVGLGIGVNYGSVLTYYSLYRTIESFGKSVLMVSKIGAQENDPELSDTHALKFAKEHYNLSPVYGQASVAELNNLVDTFVLGSDQVWNHGISRNFGKSFYLDFASDSKRKISYAASFGHAKDFTPIEEVPEIAALMRRFHAISVREDSGVLIARDIYNTPATQVAEPIFLTERQGYMELAARSDREVSSPYLLAYILDPTPEKKAAIEFVARTKGLDVRIILDAWPHLIEKNKSSMNMPGAVEDNVDVYDFLKLYANASYVITDSFHGTAFALKFEKPFASIGNKRRGIARFKSLFSLVGHQERFTPNAEDIIQKSDNFLGIMDYADIRSRLNAHVDMSKKWLKTALEKPIAQTISAGGETVVGARGISITHHPSARKLVRKASEVARYMFRKQKLDVRAPSFSANSNAWQIAQSAGAAQLRVASLADSIRGNFVWTDLPDGLRKDAAYEMTLDWTIHSSVRLVNVHIRNPETGKFRVVGTVSTDGKSGIRRVDKLSFPVATDGFYQIMFGAVHFTGEGAGADIYRISLRSIRPSEVVPNAASATAIRRKDAAAAVRELTQRDTDRFIKYYAKHRNSSSSGNARSLLMFYSHGFEKGLSRSGGFRPGFGEDYMNGLASEMNKWMKDGRDPSDSFFMVAASTMQSYFERHRQLNFDVSHFWKLFHPAVQDHIKNAKDGLGGVLSAASVREPSASGLPQREFQDVVYARRSIREFLEDPVHNEDIAKAVQIAMQAPSVCNRQPARVHLIENIAAMRAALDLQGGFRGYKLPPKLLLVTSDISAFVGAVERNQAFIDGGLFMMLLLLGLEQMGLGSCSLNTAMNGEREDAIRKILGIPENEVFISFVAVGYFDPAVLTPKSTRLPVDEVLILQARA